MNPMRRKWAWPSPPVGNNGSGWIDSESPITILTRAWVGVRERSPLGRSQSKGARPNDLLYHPNVGIWAPKVVLYNELTLDGSLLRSGSLLKAYMPLHASSPYLPSHKIMSSTCQTIHYDASQYTVFILYLFTIFHL